jgi:hypothetical protein
MGLYARLPWLSRLSSRERPPAEVVALLAADERVTSWAALPSGGFAVGTPLGLWLPAPSGHARTRWHLIIKAAWTAPRLTLTTGVEGSELAGAVTLQEQPARVLALPEPALVPKDVRDRVTRSVRYSAQHGLAPGGGAWVVARRVAGQDGLVWQVRFEPGTDADDPLLREQVSRLVAEAREAVDPVIT